MHPHLSPKQSLFFKLYVSTICKHQSVAYLCWSSHAVTCMMKTLVVCVWILNASACHYTRAHPCAVSSSCTAMLCCHVVLHDTVRANAQVCSPLTLWSVSNLSGSRQHTLTGAMSVFLAVMLCKGVLYVWTWCVWGQKQTSIQPCHVDLHRATSSWHKPVVDSCSLSKRYICNTHVLGLLC